MKTAFAVVALAAYGVMATAAPLSSQPDFMPSVTLAVAPLYEISLDAGLRELSFSDPAMIVLGLQPAEPDPEKPPPFRIPLAPIAFGGGTIVAFLAILLAAYMSLKPNRQVEEFIRPMAYLDS